MLLKQNSGQRVERFNRQIGVGEILAVSRENIKDVTCQSDRQFDRQFDRQSDRQFDGQLAWALRAGITLARWLANPMHLCYANLDYALLYIDIRQRALLLSSFFSLQS